LVFMSPAIGLLKFNSVSEAAKAAAAGSEERWTRARCGGVLER
jgi:hypothetical protein